jgi:site-specific DNA recombinase
MQGNHMPHLKQGIHPKFISEAPSHGQRKALLCARVSSKEQEQGFSLPAQTKFLRAYGAQIDVTIVKEFSFAESAKEQGRKHFNEVLEYLRTHREVTVALFEKTDRLSRNMKDYVAVEELVEALDIEIHLVKEGQILRKTTKSQDRLVQGIFALLARNYIQNMQEEISKGQVAKAEKGQFPGRARYGYMHDRITRTIVEQPKKGEVVRSMFRLYATGEHSVDSLRKSILTETGEKISKANIHRMLKDRFYIGYFVWRGVEYQGKHPHLTDYATFARVQDVVSGRTGNKSKSRKHSFAFTHLVTCSKDGCLLTAELAKGKYTYYRCSFGKGRHKVPFIPEPMLADLLGQAVMQIRIPAQVAENILAALVADQERVATARRGELDSATQRLNEIEGFKRQAYRDRLYGVIDESLWRSINIDWNAEQLRLQTVLQSTSDDALHQIDTVRKTLELAQISQNKWVGLHNSERAKLARIVLSNCSSDGVSLTYDYRKPFDLIVNRAKNEEWRRE